MWKNSEEKEEDFMDYKPLVPTFWYNPYNKTIMQHLCMLHYTQRFPQPRPTPSEESSRNPTYT
ncbi:Uncharacterized protein APZ42_025530 [Daphnia magna]|uniref:Uncharacterized protein n=1 Tax=Daphnia magna TaxID=35525 RepID=A0A164SZ56_9CRUS|nr:Uncharacterized protein APZ42_025530 [Daphnia magna]